MTEDGENVSRPAPPIIPSYLSEQMTVSRLVETLEALHFNKKYGQARVVIDEGVVAFLIRAAKAAAADPGVKVRHAWRAIKSPR
jgi:hypothetical protein